MKGRLEAGTYRQDEKPYYTVTVGEGLGAINDFSWHTHVAYQKDTSPWPGSGGTLVAYEQVVESKQSNIFIPWHNKHEETHENVGKDVNVSGFKLGRVKPRLCTPFA
jgi:hypothetical protein